MKLIKKGLNAKDGIHIICPCCFSEYVIENSNDWSILNTYCWQIKRSLPIYLSKCPSCGYEMSLGLDISQIKKNISPGTIISFPAEYNSNFDIVVARYDWHDRYEVTCSEQ